MKFDSVSCVVLLIEQTITAPSWIFGIDLPLVRAFALLERAIVALWVEVCFLLC